MKNITCLLISLFTSQIIIGQSFQEVCADANTNGTVVNYQYFQDTIYAAGFFNILCDEQIPYIAKWVDEEWQASNIAISEPVHSLNVIDDKLYIAKYKESIDSNWVYVYDNTSLEKVGQGVYLTTASGFSQLPNIYDIIEYDGSIVACGEFDRVGQSMISGIMTLNGNNWEALGEGLSGNIPNTAPVMFPHQMLVHNGDLYVIGNFRNAGAEVVNGIAKWTGSEWVKMGEGFNNTVYSIAIYNDEIIVGGSFTQSGSTTINRIAKWNGQMWVPLDFGFTNTSPNDFTFIHTLKVIDEILYIGGGLKEITYSDNSTQACNGIVSYDGTWLNTFEGGVPGNDIEAIEKTDDGRLLIGGGVFGNGYSGITDINTSVIELENSYQVKTFPNPASDFLSVHFENEVPEVVNLIDVNGKLIKSETKLSKKNQFDLSDVLPGVYFLQFVGNEKRDYRRFLIH